MEEGGSLVAGEGEQLIKSAVSKNEAKRERGEEGITGRDTL